MDAEVKENYLRGEVTAEVYAAACCTRGISAGGHLPDHPSELFVVYLSLEDLATSHKPNFGFNRTG